MSFSDHIPAIDGPEEPAEPQADSQSTQEPAAAAADPSPSPEAPQEPAEPAAEADPQPPADGNWFPDKPDLNEAIKKLAGEIPNLNPNDPDGLKTLRRMAEKDLFIAKQKAEKAEYERKLTAFEKQLSQTQKPQQQDKPQAQPQPHAQQHTKPEGQTERIGSDWRGPADAQRAYAEAWGRTSQDGKADPDFERAAAVLGEDWNRRFLDAVPFLEQRVQERMEQMLQERFGDVMPHMGQVARERVEAQNLEFAMSELEQTAGYDDIRSLIEPTDGPPVVVNGEPWANSLFAQAVKEAPHILKINVQGRTPEESDRLTLIERLRSAQDVLNAKKARDEQIKRAADAGKAIQQREEEGRIRHSLNRGEGTGQLNGGKKPSYVEELLAL